MSDMPAIVRDSALWGRLNGHEQFRAAIEGMREIAASLASKAEHVLPEFTDHSVTHMDALWQVTSEVLTADETEKTSPAEAFILGASFYVHDLGMAIGATHEGREELAASAEFASSFEHLTKAHGLDEKIARECALKVASRELHAKLAERFVDDVIPGLDRHLLESTEMRLQWGAMIGQIAASHHWSLRTVEERLGKRGSVPSPLASAGQVDLGFVGCVLRIVDYAHINAGRAKLLSRILRSNVPPSSLMHWQAQENINGPTREGALLVFASTRPIESTDGWWTFYEMIRGLSAEIEGVSEYLAARNASQNRFSLKGVKGASSARQFASFVETSGFEPIDVRFRPDSMERLVELLGGKTLYGNDIFAPLREILQNAADAVRLRWAAEKAAGLAPSVGGIRVALESNGDETKLDVSDDGVGMNERVITNYLLGIASDYWHSPDFFADHPHVFDQGFKPVGRFGIGFLSVFMLGQDVEVETQRYGGGDSLKLKLRGVGRRGVLTRRAPKIRSGTSVRITLSAEHKAPYAEVQKVVQARAPMLDVPISVSDGKTVTTLAPKWWRDVSQEEFSSFLVGQREATNPRRYGEYSSHWDHYLAYRSPFDLRDFPELARWPVRQPEAITDNHRILAVPGSGGVLLCSKGFAIGWHSIAGLMGIVDEPNLQLNAARNSPIEWDSNEFRLRLLADLAPHILEALNGLRDEPNIPARYDFLVDVAQQYGSDLLSKTTLPWITVVEPPGRADLFNPATLRANLEKVNEVVLAYGIGPWTIARLAREHHPDAPQRGLMIPISAVGQAAVRYGDGYEEKQKLLVGPLHEHFSSKTDTTSQKVGNATLLNIILDIVATAWHTDKHQLSKMKWSSKSEELCGYLTR